MRAPKTLTTNVTIEVKKVMELLKVAVIKNSGEEIDAVTEMFYECLKNGKRAKNSALDGSPSKKQRGSSSKKKDSSDYATVPIKMPKYLLTGAEIEEIIEGCNMLQNFLVILAKHI